MKKSSLINISIFLVVLLLALLNTGFPDSILFLFTNSIIIFMTLMGTFEKPNQYFSLSKLFYLFNFIFFGIVPFLMLMNDIHLRGSSLDIGYYIFANIIIIMTLLVYKMVYRLYVPKIKKDKLIEKEKTYRQIISRNRVMALILLVVISIVSSVLILHYHSNNFMNLFYRETLSTHSKMEFLIVSYVFTSLPVISALVFIYIKEFVSYKWEKLYLFFFLSMMIMFVFPTSTARFFALTVYLALILSTTKVFFKAYRIQYVFLLAILTVFPFLDQFRFMKGNKEISFNFSLDYLLTGHFDAYQNFARLLSIDYISYGYQLLGSLFFYIPRSIWVDKPVGSGLLLAEHANLSWHNITMPFVGEGYINFGILGSILFVAILAYISKRFDTTYWIMKNQFDQMYFFPLYYLALGLTIFMLRGDLLSSVAYMSAILGLYYFLIRFMILIGRIKL